MTEETLYLAEKVLYLAEKTLYLAEIENLAATKAVADRNSYAPRSHEQTWRLLRNLLLLQPKGQPII